MTTFPNNQQFCCTCLSTTNELDSVFNDNLIEIILECASVEIDTTDTTQLICGICKFTLIHFNQFKQRCAEVNAILKGKERQRDELLSDFKNEVVSLLEEDTIKIELVDVDEDWDGLENEPKTPPESKKPVHTAIKCFVCKYCKKIFNDKEQLKNHTVEEHQTPTTYTCPYCNKSYSTLRTLLVQHIAVNHRKKNASYKCTDCIKTFHLAEQRDEHVANKHTELTCNVCSKPIKGIYALQLHLKRHLTTYLVSNEQLNKETIFENKENDVHVNSDEQNGTSTSTSTHLTNFINEKKEEILYAKRGSGEFQCPYCPRKFPEKRYVTRHVYKHTNERVFSCSECSKKYNELSHLTAHVKQTHSATPQFKCEQCPQQFFVEQALRKHVTRVHFDGTCNLCGKQGIKTFKKFRDHISNVHTPGESYNCKLCDKLFKRKRSFEIHMDRHKGVDFSKICNICGLKFTNLEQHMYNKHQIGKRTFTCRRCNATFNNAKESRVHAKLYHRVKRSPDEYQFECPTCQKKLLTMDNLRSHIQKIHENPKIFSCSPCNKQFRCKGDYRSHMRIHTNERPYPCDICPLKFRRSYGLLRHRRIHTGEKKFNCTMCGKAFLHYNSLVAHKKSHARDMIIQPNMFDVKLL